MVVCACGSSSTTQVPADTAVPSDTAHDDAVDSKESLDTREDVVDTAIDTAEACPSPRVLCGATCTDLAADPKNCGACGKACVKSAACITATCICPTSFPDPCPSGCTNLDSDRDNCGVCGVKCASTCSSGKCV